MRRLILDTHIILWWLAEPELLSKKQFDAISAGDAQIFISSASIWEIRIKEKLGKLEVPSDLVSLIKQEGFQFLPVSELHTDFTRNLPDVHKDPFDRIIISQAKLEELIVLTCDKCFREYGLEIL